MAEIDVRNPMLWCFDPGQTTGIAGFDLASGSLITLLEIETWHHLDAYIHPKDRVVAEQITWRSPSFNPVGLEVIGALKFLCDRLQVEITLQSPGAITGVLKWPIYDFSSIRSQHEIDALAHGIYWHRSHSRAIHLPEQFIRR